MCLIEKFWVRLKHRFLIATQKPPISRIIARNSIDPIDTATIGDGADDLEMLHATSIGVTFEGKPLLLEEVAIRLKHTGLRGLLYLQGYKERDFFADKI